MPTQTFFNLANEKQEKIISIAKNEFSQHGFYDASINRIVKDSNISRGSFYQYFENKEDLFIFILDKCKNSIIENITNKLKEKKHDIFQLHLLIYDEITSDGIKKDDKEFVITTIGNMNMKLLNHLLSFLTTKDIGKDIEVAIELIDIKSLKINSMEDLINLNQILMNLMMSQLAVFFSNLSDVKSCRNDLKKKYDLIKYGVLRD